MHILYVCSQCPGAARRKTTIQERSHGGGSSEIYESGGLDAPDYTLTEVIALTVGSAGAIYVAQWRDPSVHVFDSSGNFIGAIGRRGAGPGEFSQPADLGWVDDALWVVDMPMGRVSLFGRRGEFYSSFNVVSPPISEYYSGLAPIALLADGFLLSQPSAAGHLFSRGVVTSLPILRSDRSVERLDTLAWFSMQNATLEVKYGGGTLFSKQPLSDSDLYDAYSDGRGLITVKRPAPLGPEPSRFQVTRLGHTGDTVFSKSIPYRPVSLTGRTVDSLIASIVAIPRRGSLLPEDAIREAVREALYVPDFLPPVKKVLAGRDGTIWLERATWDADSAVWDVLDKNGEHVARVTVPPGLRLF